MLQFIGFSGVGAVGTSAHYALFLALIQAGSVAPVRASAAGFLLGALVNYILNYRFVFKSSAKHGAAMLKFLAVATVGLALNVAAMSVAIDRLAWHYLIAQLAATGLVLLWNFAGNRFWTFREGRHGATA